MSEQKVIFSGCGHELERVIADMSCPVCARKEVERLQARVEALANFNPDWDMLEATQESLREHMQIIRKLNDGIDGLTRANEALIETNKELTTEARGAFAAGFKARHETPDINRAWEDWYTRQNTDSGNQCSHEWCDIATGGQYCRLCDERRPEYEGMAYDD